MKRKHVELLAPAGSPEGFYGAVHAGADAVYLGGNRFGARAYADNFTEAELLECIRYAHVFGRKVYLTVNTLIKEKEFAELFSYLLPYYQVGLDGVIIQDIGVLALLRKAFPGMELHASTQMTITGQYGASFLKELGVCRIVPARELGLREIQTMKEASGLEMETFIHGAMCYCYSGQCLFSSVLGGRSGNRGRCAQPCRLPYQVKADNKISQECYPLSLKDMCTIENLPELIEAGIDSFKIEGRMKKPEYAAGVTAIYRKYIDRYYQHVKAGSVSSYQVEVEDLQLLNSLYIRSGRQDGYYHKHNGADMVTLASPAYNGSDETQLLAIRRQYLQEKPVLPITLKAVFAIGVPAQLTMEYEGIPVTVYGDIVQTASRQPVTEENVSRQIKKLGDTPFFSQSVEIHLDEQAFYPLGEINALRRKAVRALEDKLIQENGLSISRENQTGPSKMQGTFSLGKESGFLPGTAKEPGHSPQNEKELTVVLRTWPQFNAFLQLLGEEQKFHWKRVYLDSDLLAAFPSGQTEHRVAALSEKVQIFLALPYILRKRDESYLKKVEQILEQPYLSGCMARTLEAYAFLKDIGYRNPVTLDAGMYVWNLETVHFWQNRVSSFCLPLELNAGEQRDLLNGSVDNFPVEKIVYGRIPMMITANCVLKTTGKCQSEENRCGTVFLHDRFHKDFPVVADCCHCMNVIYNSVVLSLHDSLHKWQKKAALRLDFTIENEQETTKVLRYYRDLLITGNAFHNAPDWEYTTGHEKRGVE